MPISMPVDAEANELLTRSPLALLIAMLLDQQVPLERAFSAPRDLVRRLGHEPTAEELARLIVAEYDGDPAAVWSTASSGAELLKRVSALPGFGEQKAKIFVALLGKQLGVQPPGWREAAGTFGAEGSHLSVADITDAESLGRVRAYKQQLKAAAKGN